MVPERLSVSFFFSLENGITSPFCIWKAHRPETFSFIPSIFFLFSLKKKFPQPSGTKSQSVAFYPLHVPGPSLHLNIRTGGVLGGRLLAL